MKILAIDKLLPGANLDKIKPHLKEEAKMAWENYVSGIIREIYFRQDKPGAVLIMECKDVEEAKKLLSELPLVKERLIEFEFIPLGAFTPFETLFEA